ncbi:MAG: peptide chain release factor aRF-1 [Candidatus Micrarchaeaceae archaeon]
MNTEYEIRTKLKKLRSIKGSGTELISIYIPPKFSISDEMNKLRDERGRSGNIKSKTTRLNVQGAIDKIMQYLKLFKEPPPNGLAIFCGNISNEQATPDIELFTINPPQPVWANIYRCDSSFLLEPLEEMISAKDMYCLVVLDGREATIALLRGTHITIEKKLRSFAHAKVRKGGQSANRYERAISESIDDYYKSVSYAINDVFAKYDYRIKGLIVGGPGPSKENFVKIKHLNYQIKILGIYDTGYTDEHMGINELLEKAKDLLSEQSAIQERVLMERFLNAIANNGLATYGYEKVLKALQSNNVEKLLINEDIEIYDVHYKCTKCNAEFNAIEEGEHEQAIHEGCGGKLEIIKKEDAIENLMSLADKNDVEIIFVASDSQYGKELLMGFHGIGALLKYKQ